MKKSGLQSPFLFDMAGGVFILGMLGIVVVIPVVVIIVILSIGSVRKAKVNQAEQVKLNTVKNLSENKDSLK